MAPSSHIEHVVVLMLENRSYDHMLGFLGEGPAYKGVKPTEEFSNPRDPSRPGSSPVFVSDDAEFRLAIDGPHSHARVMEQLAVDTLGRPRMNGFISAYAKKLAGNDDDDPVYNRPHIALAGLAVLMSIAGAAALPWPATGIACGAMVVGALAGVEGLARRERAIPRGWLTRARLAPPAVVGAAMGVGSILRAWDVSGPTRLGGVALALGAGGVAGYAWFRSRKRKPPTLGNDCADSIMRCMHPDSIPALATLARNFVVCTDWHCSVPGATWPNRCFAHAGTSDGTVDIEPDLYGNTTIFDQLGAKGWRIYCDPNSAAQVIVYDSLTERDVIGNWHPLRAFADHCKDDDLPAYSFIEPIHTGKRSNSQHPGNNDYDAPRGTTSDFERGDMLIAWVYEQLRTSPSDLLDRTMFVVTYDEHGGFYDHVAPPRAKPPGGSPKRKMRKLVDFFVYHDTCGFAFDRLGVRVPTVVVSARVPKAPDDTVYDHTSLPRTLRALFAPEAPRLSDREDLAATFHHLASLDEARTDLPDLSARVDTTALFGGDDDEADATPAFRPLQDEAAPPQDRFIEQLAEKEELVQAKLQPLVPGPIFGPQADEPPPTGAQLITLLAAQARGETP